MNLIWNMAYSVSFPALAVSAALLCSCGDTISDSQDFVPNEDPLITSMTVVHEDGNPIDLENILPGEYYTVTASVSDPEGQELSFGLKSNCGSFSNPEFSAGVCSATFLTDVPKGGAGVAVTLTATDAKNGKAEKTVTIGRGKDAPQILSLTPATMTVSGTGAATFTVTADCDGSFHIFYDNSLSAEDVRFSSSTSPLQFGYTKGTTATAAVYGCDGSSTQSYKLRLPGAGPYKVWVVFKDRIEQEAVGLCTVTAN